MVTTGSGAGGTCSDFLAGVGGEEEEIGEFVSRQQGYTFQKHLESLVSHHHLYS